MQKRSSKRKRQLHKNQDWRKRTYPQGHRQWNSKNTCSKMQRAVCTMAAGAEVLEELDASHGQLEAAVEAAASAASPRAAGGGGGDGGGGDGGDDGDGAVLIGRGAGRARVAAERREQLGAAAQRARTRGALGGGCTQP